MAEQQKVTLPADVMKVIGAVTSNSDLHPAERLLGVMMLVFGYAWFDPQDKIDPTRIALPSQQWREVCGMLSHGVPRDAADAVNLAFAWMNSGPSSFDD